MSDWTVGVDIGGTKIEVIVVNGTGELLGQGRRPTVFTSPKSLLEAIALAVEETVAKAGGELAGIDAIGVGVPGQVDPVTGEVRLAVNLKLRDYPLGDRLADRLERPIALENDIRLAALGAYRHVRHRLKIDHLAYLGIGTGVAAGIVLNGRLFRGAHGLAGEIGHVIVKPDGARCNCGNQGCLETVVAGPAILRRAQTLWPPGEPQPADVAAVFTAAESGHPVATAVVEATGATLAQVVYSLMLVYDINTVVIGGGVVSGGKGLRQPFVQELERLRAESPLARLLLDHDKIQLLPDGMNAGAWGAVWLARSRHTPLEVSME